jgi:membrane protein
MPGLIEKIKSYSHLIKHQLWKVRLNKLDKKQGFLVKQIRVFSLSTKRFNEDQCLIKASALTYFLLFSIVPVIALAFAIAKGFGFQETLENNLLRDFSEQKEVLTQVFDYANIMLNNAKGGVIAGVGVVLLLWSVMKLLGNIEDSFNDIWEVKKPRSFIRKFTDYFSILLIAPIFIIISGSITVIIQSQLDSIIHSTAWLKPIEHIVGLILRLFSLLLITGLFTFLYVVLPNTKVKVKPAFYAAIVAAILFELLEFTYINFQIGVARYNAIYGSFAALPLFLIWVQYSWYVVLFGAELAYAYQHIDQFELKSEILNISYRYKKMVAILTASRVVKNFTEGKKAMTLDELSHELDLPVRLVKPIVEDFVETGIFNPVRFDKEEVTRYQPGMSEQQVSICLILEAIDKKGVNEMHTNHQDYIKISDDLLIEFEQTMKDSKTNLLVKDVKL